MTRLYLFSLSTLMIAAVACSPLRREREVVVYVAVDQNYAEPLLEDFARSSGIRVLPVFDVEAAKTTGLVNRLIAEKARPRADVFWNGEFVQTLLLKQRGILAPYRSPEADLLPEGYADPEGYWACSGARCRVILTRPELLPKGLSMSMEALLDPRLAPHQAGLSLPLFGTGATHAAALYSTRGAAPALAYYERLKARGVRVVAGNSVVRDLVVSGELALGLTDSDDACGALRKGAPVRVELPDQDDGGTLVIPGTVAMVAGGPNVSEGKALVDYLLSAAAEDRMIRSGFFQLSIRRPDQPSGCLEGMRLKALAVTPQQVFEHFERSRSEMGSLFVQ